MPRDDERELLEAVAETRRALKGMQRQARQTLQLATDLEERLETFINRSAIGGTANDHETQSQAQHRPLAQAVSA